MEELYYVYVHINKINGKRYYGITSEKIPEKRWKKGYYHNKHFQSAIMKYGWDNFEHIIIAQGLSRTEAEQKEAELIREYETINPENGYNLTTGGGLGVTRHSEKSKKLMSKHTSGALNPMYGKHHSDETREKIRKALTNHPNMSKRVMCIETGVIYESLREAERKTGIDRKGIGQAAKSNGTQKTAGGFHWKIVVEEGTENSDF